MKIKTLLIAVPISDKNRSRIAALLPDSEIIYKEKAPPEDFDRADVIFGNVGPKQVADKPNLKWVHTSSAGTDHIARVISPETLLTNSTGAYGPGISEYMIAVILSAIKRLPEYQMNQRAHKWNIEGMITNIEGSVVLSLGLGNIGSTFSRKMKALGAYTIGVRRLDASKPDYMDEVHLYDKIDELLPRADIVALSLPNNSETYHTLSAARIPLMKPGSVVVNIGRGRAIDTEALMEGLQVGRPGFACLDVTDPEPLPPGHPLWDMRNVIITPHCSGWQTNPSTHDLAAEIFIAQIAAYIEDKPLRNIVDRETGYRKTILR